MSESAEVGSTQVQRHQELGSLLEVLSVSTRLGLTSFGGPVAHLGYFHEEYVKRRQWIDEQSYADLVALCQFLPGPASSQVGIAIGIARARLLGGVRACIKKTTPSALALIAFAFGIGSFASTGDAGWLHGLKVVAVAVVAQAVWGMARSLCPDRPRITLAIVAAVLVLAEPVLGVPVALSQILVIVLGAAVGWRLFAPAPVTAPSSMAGDSSPSP